MPPTMFEFMETYASNKASSFFLAWESWFSEIAKKALNFEKSRVLN